MTERKIYIGRPSTLGNPFAIGQHGDREEVIAKYAELFSQWMEDDDSLQFGEVTRLFNMLQLGESLRLECYCAPLACHGDVIKAYLTKLMKEFREPVPTITVIKKGWQS